MKRALLKGPRDFVIEEVDEPAAGAGEVLVRVSACGICGSDLHSYCGTHPLVIYPVVPGHEFCGTIESVGEGTDAGLAGMRVCVEPSLYCGTCPQCMSGRYNICQNLRVMGFQAPGAMCELINVPANRIHPLPAEVGFEAGALVEPAAVAVHALKRSKAEPGSWIAVIGGGVIGTMLLRVASSNDFRVLCVEKDAARAARAAASGAKVSLVFGNETAREMTEATGGELAAVFECVGSAETLGLAIESAPRGSTVVVVGVFGEPVPLAASLVQDGELELTGTLMYTGEDFRRAIDLLQRGAIDPSHFITNRVPLEEVEDACKLLLDPDRKAFKVLVKPGV